MLHTEVRSAQCPLGFPGAESLLSFDTSISYFSDLPLRAASAVAEAAALVAPRGLGEAASRTSRSRTPRTASPLPQRLSS